MGSVCLKKRLNVCSVSRKKNHPALSSQPPRMAQQEPFIKRRTYFRFFPSTFPCMKSKGNHGNLALYRTELSRLKTSSGSERRVINHSGIRTVTHTYKHIHTHTNTHTPALSTVTCLHRPGIMMTFCFSSASHGQRPEDRSVRIKHSCANIKTF